MNPILALIIANIVWGGGLPLFKHSFETFPPFLFAFLRFSLASFVLLPLIWNVSLKKITKHDWKLIIIGNFFSIFLNISALFLGLERASSITAGVFAASQPIFFFFLSVILLKEKVEKKVLHGILVSLIGVCIIIFMPILQYSSSADTSVSGVVLYFIATIGAVLGPIILKPVLGKINSFVITYFGFIISAVLFLPIGLYELYTNQLGAVDTLAWVGLAYGTFGSSTIAYMLFNYGAAKVSAQELGVFSYINPIIAAVVSTIVLMSPPDIYFYVGAIIVFIGILVSEGKFHHPIKKRA